MDKIINSLQKYWLVALGVAMGLLILLIKLPEYLMFQKSLHWLAAGAAFLCAIIGVRIGWLWKNNTSKNLIGEYNTHPPTLEMVTNEMLTNRESEVLTLIAMGLSNEEIAARLFVSLSTIKTHTSNIFGKLNVKRRTQAVTKAREMGLIS